MRESPACTQWLLPPINLSTNYAVSLSTQQSVAILVIVLLTFLNTRGLQLGKLIDDRNSTKRGRGDPHSSGSSVSKMSTRHSLGTASPRHPGSDA